MIGSTLNLQINVDRPGRFLVWGLAFRQQMRPLAHIWLESLLKIGKWNHDILLLGDEIVPEFAAPRLKTINIVKDIEVRYNFPRQKWNRWTYNNLKSQILNYIDPATYDYLLYLDIDVFVNSNRLESLVRNKWEKGLIAVQRDRTPLDEGRLRSLAKMGMPDVTEKDRWAQRPICAGIIGFPMNFLGLSILQDYCEACVKMRFNLSDQAKLTALLNRKYDGSWDFFGDTTHGQRSAPPYDETLIHFTGRKKVFIEPYFKSRLSISTIDLSTK